VECLHQATEDPRQECPEDLVALWVEDLEECLHQVSEEDREDLVECLPLGSVALPLLDSEDPRQECPEDLVAHLQVFVDLHPECPEDLVVPLQDLEALPLGSQVPILVVQADLLVPLQVRCLLLVWVEALQHSKHSFYKKKHNNDNPMFSFNHLLFAR